MKLYAAHNLRYYEYYLNLYLYQAKVNVAMVNAVSLYKVGLLPKISTTLGNGAHDKLKCNSNRFGLHSRLFGNLESGCCEKFLSG